MNKIVRKNLYRMICFKLHLVFTTHKNYVKTNMLSQIYNAVKMKIIFCIMYKNTQLDFKFILNILNYSI